MERRDFEGRKIYLAALRRLTGEERLTLAFELRELVMEVARAGIQAQHPYLKDEGVQTILARRVMEANGAARILDSDPSYLQDRAAKLSVANSLARLQKGGVKDGEDDARYQLDYIDAPPLSIKSCLIALALLLMAGFSLFFACLVSPLYW